jgi:hypothetical protein
MLLPIKIDFEKIIEEMMLKGGINDKEKKEIINDGCIYKNKNCICGNTGRKGICDYGLYKSGLYCRCD